MSVDLQNALLHRAEMERVSLWRAKLEDADFRNAQMARSFLMDVELDNVDLRYAQLEGAIFARARIVNGTDLSRANLQHTSLNFTLFDGRVKAKVTVDRESVELLSLSLHATNFKASTNLGGAVRYMSMSSIEYDEATDFRNAFMDGSVDRTPAFTTSMGAPCQWVRDVLNDEKFFGRWRGWIEHETNPAPVDWLEITLPGFEDVTPIPPDDPNCEWKTDPMPGTE